MKIEKITPQIAALYLGQKCDIKFDKLAQCEVKISTIVIGLFEGGRITITPHLRRLETITEEEARELHLLYSNGKEWQPYYTKDTCLDWWHGEITLARDRDDFCIGYPFIWLNLLSKGFDIFGLIDAGLAKEVTTQTNEL